MRYYFACLIHITFVIFYSTSEIQALEVIFAINAGGEAHIDSHGIKFERDPLHGKIGVASDYGKQLAIGRVPPSDQILYQTERYHHTSFGYDIPLTGDGDYVLILKFSEVYFNGPQLKVFDISINRQVVFTHFDIFEKVGRGVAHDEYIPFTVQRGRMFVKGHDLEVRKGKLRVDFVKGYKDNPKINAICVIRGTMSDVPKLPPLPQENEVEYVDEEILRPEEKKSSKSQHTSGPRTPDPYSVEDSSVLLPVFLAIGAFFPVLFCLCRL